MHKEPEFYFKLNALKTENCLFMQETIVPLPCRADFINHFPQMHIDPILPLLLYCIVEWDD